MTKYVVAVSGGVDSVVLLDLLVKQGLDLVVAHFDHGIRLDSGLDAMFVAGLARRYDLPFEFKREALGPDASEELARNRRYRFLREVAKKHNAKLVTAHHADDVIESIAINLTRGTGWRGLAVLDSDVERFLTDHHKEDLIKYARNNNLNWYEDSTNSDEKYLRNSIRKKAKDLHHDKKRQLLSLWVDQKRIKRLIQKEVESLIGKGPSYDRHFFINIDDASAIECLRYITSGRLTNPQLSRLLHLIKSSKSGRTFEIGSKVNVKFTTRNFTVTMLK